MKTTLKDLRNQCNRTLAEVAKALYVPLSTYANYEQGTRTIDIRLIIPLAELYGVSEKEIIEAQINSIDFSASN